MSVATPPDEVTRPRRLRVVETRDVSDCVRSFRLCSGDGRPLEPWLPGAHLDLFTPSGLLRQYSLCGDPAATDEYEIAVLREPESRGGSIEMHDQVHLGVELTVRAVRNHFALHDAPAYLFIAGGVGITPILPMVQAAAASGAEWRLVYGGRSRSSMAFVDRLESSYPDRVDIVPQDVRGLPDLAGEIGAVSADTLVYACGPDGLLRAVEAACEAVGRRANLRLERFTSTGELVATTGSSFEVELSHSGKVLLVGPDTTILQAVREVVPETLSSCEEGFCGTCETRVLGGIPEHRDSVLSDEEREANATMMICVGRSKSPRLILDI